MNAQPENLLSVLEIDVPVNQSIWNVTGKDAMPFVIRSLTTYEEMLDLLRLQREIWGYDEPDVGLYPPLLSTAAKNGGSVLGAFDAKTDELIAFLFGFLGRESGGPLKLCSQVLGVTKAWRRRGVGEALKWAQREQALSQGLRLITWTFDPLEGPNAHLNLHKLGGISYKYLRDIYGTHIGTLNAGLPTDRLLVEWWVDGPRLKVERNGRGMVHKAVPIFSIGGRGVDRYITQVNLDLEAPLLGLDTVADIHPLKAKNLDLALDWRLQMRAAFETYFARGYIAVDFQSTINQGERHNRYFLRKSTPSLIANIGIVNGYD